MCLSAQVNKLTSVKTQLPYRFYTLPYCQPEKIQESVENLGEILAGDQIENFAKVQMGLRGLMDVFEDATFVQAVRTVTRLYEQHSPQRCPKPRSFLLSDCGRCRTLCISSGVVEVKNSLPL